MLYFSVEDLDQHYAYLLKGSEIMVFKTIMVLPFKMKNGPII